MMNQPQLPLIKTPKTDDEFIDWIRLLRSRRVGATSFHKILNVHETAQAALVALPEIATNAGAKGYEPCPIGVAKSEYYKALKLGYVPLCYGAPQYPKLLLETSDAPPLLWAKGQLECLDKPAIALIGARNASSIGRRMTELLAKELADAGFIILSGLARGIDAVAHQASLSSGTIAVVAGGIDMHYPRENDQLYQDIPQNGLLLSEQPPGLSPQAKHFPMRNRIIAGIAKAVVVMEGAARSGSLITARNALDIGRDVLAVPGHPFDGRAAGCNYLIRDGATLVRNAKDVIEAMSEPQTANHPTQMPAHKNIAKIPTEDVPKKILNLLGPTAIPEDVLIRDCGLPAKTISQHLTDLELQGRIERQPGGLLALAS